MDPQIGPSQVFLLLLFLYLSPKGGLLYLLGGPNIILVLSGDDSTGEYVSTYYISGPFENQSGEIGIQDCALMVEPLDQPPELQKDQVALGALQQGHSSEEAWKAKQATSSGHLGSRDSALQARWRQQRPKEKDPSGCFGRKMDQITFFSSLGCNSLRNQ